ncbi:MAG TPA: response regulator [Chitinophagaceae bacterium]|nr:response regulator [Chitinophagaceae bacterium]
MTENTLPPKYACVLVIDDTAMDRYIAAHSLKKFNIAAQVICKETALEGLQYLKDFVHEPDQLPDIILLDIRMPIMDGFGFLTEFEKLPQEVHLHCRIIMLSSSIDPRDHERAAGNPYVIRFISKPLIGKKIPNI